MTPPSHESANHFSGSFALLLGRGTISLYPGEAEYSCSKGNKVLQCMCFSQTQTLELGEEVDSFYLARLVVEYGAFSPLYCWFQSSFCGFSSLAWHSHNRHDSCKWHILIDGIWIAGQATKLPFHFSRSPPCSRTGWKHMAALLPTSLCNCRGLELLWQACLRVKMGTKHTECSEESDFKATCLFGWNSCFQCSCTRKGSRIELGCEWSPTAMQWRLIKLQRDVHMVQSTLPYSFGGFDVNDYGLLAQFGL